MLVFVVLILSGFFYIWKKGALDWSGSGRPGRRAVTARRCYPTICENAPLAAAVEAFDADAITGGKFDRGELTLEIAPAKIVSVCGFLKYDQKFVRLSTVTAVDRYPAEPRFEVVYHLHSVERNERVRLKCRLAGRGSRRSNR